MHFLVDAQLPPALARWIAGQGHEADHVVDLGLESASDEAIWRHASGLGAVIVTKDEDFGRRRALTGSGPQVVWLRVGNMRRQALLHWLANIFPQILEALVRGDSLVEIRDG